MKRGSFIKRLLGLAATAVVAPQVLADRVHEPDVPGVDGTTLQFPLRKGETVQFTAIPARPHEIWVDGQGRNWYTIGVEQNVIYMQLLEPRPEGCGPTNKLIHPPYNDLSGMVRMCSARPEGSI